MKTGWKLCSGCMNDEHVKQQKHHIQKQQLILDFSNEEEARYWHKTASDFFYNHLLPPLSHVLDQYAPKDKHYFINRLEIDVGNVYAGELKEAILKKMEDTLRSLIRSRSGAQHGGGENMHPGDQRIGDRAHLTACFYYFLEHGTLPWNSSVESIAALETAIKEEVDLDALIQDHAFWQHMHYASFRRRFYFQFSRPWVREVFNRLYTSSLRLLYALQTALLKTLPHLASSDTSQIKLKEELDEDIIRWIGLSAPVDEHAWPEHYIRRAVEKAKVHVPASDNIKIQDAVRQVLEKVGKEWKISRTFIPKLEDIFSSTDTREDTKNIPREEDEADISDQVAPSPVKEVQQDFPETESRQPPPESKEQDESHEKKPDTTSPSQPDKKVGESAIEAWENQREADAQETHSSVQPSGRSEHTDKKVSVQEAGEGIPADTQSQQTGISEGEGATGKEQTASDVLAEYYLPYAGVILTWPYLSRLFDKVGYLEDKIFKDAQLQQRAVHLLGFIASGREQCEEPELVMAKFLCGWPLRMPVEKELLLTDHEKKEAVRMLSSLISHWSVLKNTSVEGLRASFFDREGKLFQEEAQWKLIVAQKSFDMLLDYLPYTIAVIKLPWMPGMLKVDWA